MCKVWQNQPHNAKPLARREEPKQKGKGQKAKKSESSGKKKAEKKAKGKEKAPASANGLSVPEMGELSIQNRPIN